MSGEQCEHGRLAEECGYYDCAHHPQDHNERLFIARFASRIATLSEVRFALAVAAVADSIDLAHENALDFQHEDHLLEVRSQVNASAGRCDFVFRDNTDPVLIVEIDDPSHWTQSAKAGADRKRDREHLRKHVVPTMRFSNDEIAGDALGCAREALGYIAEFLDRRRDLWRRAFERARENPVLPAAATGSQPEPATETTN